MTFTDEMLEKIAKVAFNAVATYKNAPLWDKVNESERTTAKQMVKTFLDHPEDPGAFHQQWMETQVKDGWQYGEERDPDAKTDPMLVPFDELPREEHLRYTLFAQIVDTLRY